MARRENSGGNAEEAAVWKRASKGGRQGETNNVFPHDLAVLRKNGSNGERREDGEEDDIHWGLTLISIPLASPPGHRRSVPTRRMAVSSPTSGIRRPAGRPSRGMSNDRRVF